jgi:hypothetical protein
LVYQVDLGDKPGLIYFLVLLPNSFSNKTPHITAGYRLAGSGTPAGGFLKLS